MIDEYVKEFRATWLPPLEACKDLRLLLARLVQDAAHDPDIVDEAADILAEGDK